MGMGEPRGSRTGEFSGKRSPGKEFAQHWDRRSGCTEGTGRRWESWALRKGGALGGAGQG